jgi:hypothetical protein
LAGTTAYGGAFLLMRAAVRLDHLAHRCLGDLGSDGGARLVLSLFFKAVLGIERIFHFQTLSDPGLALLTGGTRVLGKNRLGGLLRAVSLRAVRRLCKQSEPTVPQQAQHCVSIDEHVVPRFTRKFRIPKGYHTIGNKWMKVEKLFFSFHCGLRALLSVVVTRGSGTLVKQAQTLLQRLRPRVRGALLYLVLDAAAAADTNALLTLAQRPKQVLLVRVPRRPSYVKAWRTLPPAAWHSYEEPGPYKGAPPACLQLAQASTVLTDTRGESAVPVAVRTIVVREKGRRGKERFHALWVFGDTELGSYPLIQQYRRRQGHEQRYRILLRDLFVDAAPSGYFKGSQNPKRPGFRPGALQLYGWVAAVASDVLEGFSKRLLPRFRHAFPRTLRRWFFQVPAQLYQGPDSLVVLLAPRHLRGLWERLVVHANADPVRIPWLGNRRLLLSLEPTRTQPKTIRPPAPSDGRRGFWC